MKRSRPGTALATALLLCVACGSARHKPRDLVVTAYSPTEAIETAEAIEIQFDRPVVDEAAVGTPVEPGALVLAPAVAWTGRWRDRQTLVIEPAAALQAGTRYEVTLAGPLRDRTGGFTFGFVHQPLAIDGVTGIDLEQVAPDGELTLELNQPVRAKDAAAHCALTDDDDKKLALVARAPDATASRIVLAPATRLATGAAYTLTCADLVAAGGNAPLAEPYILELHARPALAVVAAGPAPGATDVPADEVTIELDFTTAVTLDAVRKAITSTPAIPGLGQGWLDGASSHYRVTVDLAEHTTYKIDVANLTDVHGQALAAPYETRFTTGIARARISLETGIFALEASAKGYPVWTRNLTKFQLECAAIPRGKLVQLLTTEMNYDPWGGSDDGSPIDWKALGATARLQKHEVTGPRADWKLAELDFGGACGERDGARGVYLADLSSPEVTRDPDRPWLTPNRRRVLANVTDLGVLIKVGTASGIVWVTSLATGAPVPGAKVTVYTPEGVQVTTATTDRSGLVRIPGSAIAKAQPAADAADDAGEGGEEGFEDWDSYRSQRLIAIVEKAGDLAIVDGNWANGIQIWNFGLREERRGGVTRMRGFIQSDRGLYRPGEQVHFKGLVRELAQGTPPRIPRARKLAVEITDSRGTVIYTGTSPLSAFGGFHVDLALSPDATLGDYYVKASLAGQVFRERFMVEEYRPAAFELDVEPAPGPRIGARMAFTASARYLFGAPVVGGTVEWNLRRRSHPVRFAGYDSYAFTADTSGAWYYGDEGGEAEYGDFIADGSATTDANGNVTIVARDADRPVDAGPQDYIVSVNVTDDSDQTLGKSVVITAHQQDLYLGLHAQESVQAVNMPFGVNVVALDPDGKRIAATATLSFIRDEQRCTWQTAGSRGRNQCDRQQNVAMTRTIQIPATGTATERIFPKDPGEYQVKIETTDASGRAIITTSPIWVLGKGEAFWSGDESARMTLVASQRSYLPGDTAKLVAQANLRAPTALITIERDGVLEAEVRKLESASEGISLGIKEGWAPNVFASVTLVQGRLGEGDRLRPQMKMGVTELVVTTAHKALAVAIELDHAKVEPGAKVTGTIRVTSAGKPVKAELAVSVADEGVLSLIAYKTPDPLATFYKTFGLGVDSGTSWNRIAKLAAPDGGDPDEGGDFASSGEGKVRSRFVSSAYWNPAIVTDARGLATFTFVAPDNLTAFRVMAVAADTGDRFGAGEQRLTIAKDLMARPALPRFLGAGDPTTVGIVIHNTTDRAGTAKVTGAASGATLDRNAATIDVPANGVATVGFTTRAAEGATATFDFSVAMNGKQDAVQVTLPVVRPRVIETRTIATGVLAAGATATIDLATAAATLRDESEVVVTLDRTGLGDMEPSLRYLIQYPYGCLEQTLAKFVPLAKAKDLATSLGLPGLDGVKVTAFLEAGVAKIARHQQGDGHFSLWPQSGTYPHLTALAVWGLGEAKKAGLVVPADTIERGIAALKTWAGGVTVGANGEGATLAMTAYLLAKHGASDPSLLARLYQARAGLPIWGQAFLLRALVAAKYDATEIAALQQTMLDQLVVRDDTLVADNDADRAHYMSSDERSTAMVLAALVEVAPRHAAIGKLVAGLVAMRRPDGRWDSTEDNLWGLVALADYSRTLAKVSGTTSLAITAGGAPVATQRITGAGIATTRRSLAAFTGTKLELAATGPAHYTVRVIEARRDDGLAQQKGFTVTREYLDDRGQPLASIKAGDLITVKLTITADADRRWVAVVDPLPAGFEVVNPRLATSANTARDPALTGSSGWDVEWVHQELHDDHVEWFADVMDRGSHELVYRARAATAGTFIALPTRVEAMYEPDVLGRAASSQVTIAP